MVKGSNNYDKQRKRIARIHRRIANQRKDFLHKESAVIAKQYTCVCVEDLNMRAMSNRGFGNGKSTLDNGYGMFMQMLTYKLEDRGGRLVKVDKYYPSSQMDVKKEGKNMLIAFNPYYLMDCLKVIDDESIEWCMTNPKAPAYIRNDEAGYLYLILPVNIGQ